MSLPIHISDLPRDALLVITIYERNGPYELLPVGGTSISVFGKNGFVLFLEQKAYFRVELDVRFRKLRTGIQGLLVWPKVEGDGSSPSGTPGKVKDPSYQMTRLAKVCGYFCFVSLGAFFNV